jgi:hypothetical protein
MEKSSGSPAVSETQDHSSVANCDWHKLLFTLKENIAICTSKKWNRFDKWKGKLPLELKDFSGFAEEDLVDLEDPYTWLELLLSEQCRDPSFQLPERKRPHFVFEIENNESDGPEVKKRKEEASVSIKVPIIQDMNVSEVSGSKWHVAGVTGIGNV